MGKVQLCVTDVNEFVENGNEQVWASLGLACRCMVYDSDTVSVQGLEHGYITEDSDDWPNTWDVQEFRTTDGGLQPKF